MKRHVWIFAIVFSAIIGCKNKKQNQSEKSDASFTPVAAIAENAKQESLQLLEPVEEKKELLDPAILKNADLYKLDTYSYENHHALLIMMEASTEQALEMVNKIDYTQFYFCLIDEDKNSCENKKNAAFSFSDSTHQYLPPLGKVQKIYVRACLRKEHTTTKNEACSEWFAKDPPQEFSIEHPSNHLEQDKLFTDLYSLLGKKRSVCSELIAIYKTYLGSSQTLDANFKILAQNTINLGIDHCHFINESQQVGVLEEAMSALYNNQSNTNQLALAETSSTTETPTTETQTTETATTQNPTIDEAHVSPEEHSPTQVQATAVVSHEPDAEHAVEGEHKAKETHEEEEEKIIGFSETIFAVLLAGFGAASVIKGVTPLIWGRCKKCVAKLDEKILVKKGIRAGAFGLMVAEAIFAMIYFSSAISDMANKEEGAAFPFVTTLVLTVVGLELALIASSEVVAERMEKVKTQMTKYLSDAEIRMQNLDLKGIPKEFKVENLDIRKYNPDLKRKLQTSLDEDRIKFANKNSQKLGRRIDRKQGLLDFYNQHEEKLKKFEAQHKSLHTHHKRLHRGHLAGGVLAASVGVLEIINIATHHSIDNKISGVDAHHLAEATNPNSVLMDQLKEIFEKLQGWEDEISLIKLQLMASAPSP